jgi:WD40 repeat protein
LAERDLKDRLAAGMPAPEVVVVVQEGDAMRFDLGCALLLGVLPSADVQMPSGMGPRDFGPSQVPAKAARTDLYGDPLPRGAVARLGSVRFHHPGGVQAVRFAPDGKTLMVVGGDGKGLSLRFWQIPTGDEVQRFQADLAWSRGVGLTPDGKAVAVGHANTIYLYARSTGKLLRTFDGKHYNNTFALSADGKLLAAGSEGNRPDNPISVWEVTTGKALPPFAGRGWDLCALQFSADGKRLLSASKLPIPDANQVGIMPGAICVWDVATRQKLHEVPHSGTFVAFAPDGDTVAVEQDGALRVLSAATGKELCTFAVRNVSFAFTPDGKALVVVGAGQPPWLCDPWTGKVLRRFGGYVGAQPHLGDISPDGKLLAVVERHGHSADGLVRLWDMGTGEAIPVGGGHRDEVSSLAFAPGGKLLASGGRDRTIRLWDPATGKELRRLDGHEGEVLALAFAPDGKVLASSGADGTTCLWELGGCKQVLTFKGPTGGAQTLAFSRGGNQLVAGGKDGTVHVWELVEGKSCYTFDTDRHGSILALHQDGALALSLNDRDLDKRAPERLRVWRTGTGKPFQEILLRATKPDGRKLPCWAAALSDDERFLVACHSQDPLPMVDIRTPPKIPLLRWWDRATGQEIRAEVSGMVQALAFSPGSRWLGSGHGGSDGEGTWMQSHVAVWHTLTGKQATTFQGHTSPVRCLAFSPDGKVLASGSADHTILLWDTSGLPAAPAAKAAATAGELQAWWEALPGPAAGAYSALAQLVAHPAQAVAFLRERLQPAPAVDAQRIAALVAALDQPRYAERQMAFTELEKFGEVAELALRQALAKNPSLEYRRRAELLLAPLERAAPTPDRLRLFRAVAALEWIGTAEARQVLQALANGAPEARLTQHARAALQRLVPSP